jgi:hypothetical protein
MTVTLAIDETTHGRIAGAVAQEARMYVLTVAIT